MTWWERTEDDECFCGSIDGDQRVWFPGRELRRVPSPERAVGRADEQPRDSIEEMQPLVALVLVADGLLDREEDPVDARIVGVLGADGPPRAAVPGGDGRRPACEQRVR